MDEQEFRRLLDLFPVVRPRNYHIEIDPSRQSSSRSFPEPFKSWKEAEWEEDKKEINNQAIDVQDAFWEKLKLAVEKKVGAAEAERFSKVFHEVHRKLWWVAPGGVMAQSNFNPQQSIECAVHVIL